MSDALLVTEQTYLPVLLELLEHAHDEVLLLTFSFGLSRPGPNSPVYQIANKLMAIKKRRRKLKLKVLLEGVRETADRNRQTAALLRRAGAQVRFGSTHAKGFAVDQRYLLLGSTNLTNQSLTRNNETNVLLDAPAVVAEFSRYFAHRWKNGKHGALHLEPPLLADGDFEPVLLEMIAAAKKRLEFSIYFFSLTSVEQALIAAHVRGVHITGFINHHRSFALSYVRRTQATVRRLRAAGLKDLHFDQPDKFTHSKYLIKDRREVALGTGNWLPEDTHTHPQLYLHLKDAALARALAKHLAEQIREQAVD